MALFSLITIFLLAALALSVLVFGNYAIQLALRQCRTRRWMEALVLVAAIVTISVLTIDGIRSLDRAAGAHFAPLPAIMLLLLGMSLACLQLHLTRLRLRGEQLRRHPGVWTMLAASVAACGWSSHRIHAELQPPRWDPPILMARPLKMELETQYVGISDRGREVPLFRSATKSISPELAYHLANNPDHPKRNSSVISRGAPDTSSNCHGWVFADGQFLLDADGIKTILKDNGYLRCSTPQPGDVIVYYAGDEKPVHTGVVGGLLGDGTVIVESKWGIDGRYLHRPEDQPYSQNFAYYRSLRQGNNIVIRELNTALAKQRLPGRRVRKA